MQILLIFQNSRAQAIAKYTSSDIASTIVVMNGLAMTAGSKPSRFASIGSVQPMTFATSTVAAIVRQTVTATITLISLLFISRRSISMILPKQAAASTAPHITAVRISFQSTLNRSANCSYPSDIARITVTEDWEPEFPPVSISIGMNEVRMTCAAS